MFQIKSYLQYKNTPDSKPRVLVEGVDYDTINFNSLQNYLIWKEDIAQKIEKVAGLSDCRSLLTVEIDGVEWTLNSDVFESPFGFYALFDSVYLGGYLSSGNYGTNDIKNSKVVGSFFDDPAKYSKLLWNCSEEEGWQKVFKLLGIEL
jgi:hypothetical protein